MYDKWLNMLLGVQLFNNIEKDELKNMLYCIRPNVKVYEKKENITIQSDDFTAIGIVLEGEIVVTKDTLAGDRIIISRLYQGDIFGDIEAFASKEWLTTATTNSECTILFLPANNIVGVCPRMCMGHRLLIRNMLQIVSEKALVLNKKVEILSLKNIRKKVSTYLLEQYKQNNNCLYFDIPFKRNELAEYLLVSRPSLSRELIQMKDEGIIDFHMNSFKIVDLDALKESV